MKSQICINNLIRSFKVGDDKIEALRGVNLEIQKGEFVVVYGPSGCGKTTLLSLLAGLDQPTEGSVEVTGINIFKLNSNDLAKYRRTRVGMVFQQFNLIPTLSVLDNVAMPLLLSGVGRGLAYKRAREILRVLDISDRARHKPSQISGGQQQRVAIARAIIQNPGILLVDEPTGNLDVEAGTEIMKLLHMINRKWGRTVVLVTHNPDYTQLGDRIIYMEDGRITKEEVGRKITAESEDVDSVKYFGTKKGGSLRFWEIFRISKVHFLSKRLRTFLTVLGVALGVGSILTLVSLGVGLQGITSSQLASLDALVTVNISLSKDSIKKLDDKAVSELSGISGVTMVSPTLNYPAKVTYGSSTGQLLLDGVKENALAFEGVSLESGRNFQTDDEVVLSKAVLKSFGITNSDAILNKNIDLGLLYVPADSADLQNYKEIKLIKKVVGISSDDTISTAYMSLLAVVSMTGNNSYSTLKLKVDNRDHVEQVRNKADNLGYQTTSVVDLIKRVDRVFLITEIVLGVIGGVALIVALIGIVNIMTISLLERTHEVGVMKAIGATNRDIRKIFEYEVFLFGFWGGLTGVVGAWIFGFAINSLVAYLMKSGGIGGTMQVFTTPVSFAIEMIVLTVLVALLAGLYPSRLASKLSPMEALRYE
ncbi:MAG: ATP-binding cassette domain-containing protein [Candidatus Berkelbacteria bacterium]|nr:ATP-binding cassette domain-containing protein [Candidatus Berkelbacteria bacterium]